MQSVARIFAVPAARIGEIVQQQLFTSGGVDYREPKGDPGLFGPDSVTWRVHANPVALAIGGVTAVILELAEPRVRAGVWDHSTFRVDPLGRMSRTGEAALLITYGPRQAAEVRIKRVNRLHQKVTGRTSDGRLYRALDPELLRWVHVTAGFGFLSAYLRFVAPLSRADQDRYYAESARVGHLFGATDLPASLSEVEALFQAMRPKLGPDAIIEEFLGLVSRTSPVGFPGRPLQRLLLQASIDLLPAWMRRELRLPYQPSLSIVAEAVMRGLAMAVGAAPGGIVRQARERAGNSGAGSDHGAGRGYESTRLE
jgi:uncharacterized protein (DUF2236 family)